MSQLEITLNEISEHMDGIWDQADDLNATLISTQKYLSKIRRILIKINIDWKKFPANTPLAAEFRREFIREALSDTVSMIDMARSDLFERENLIEITNCLVDDHLHMIQSVLDKIESTYFQMVKKYRLSGYPSPRLAEKIKRNESKLQAIRRVLSSGDRLVATLIDTREQIDDLSLRLDELGRAVAKLEGRADRKEDLTDVIILIKCIPPLFSSFVVDVESSFRYINRSVKTMISLSEIVTCKKTTDREIAKYETYGKNFRFWLSKEISKANTTLKATERRLRCKDYPLKFIINEIRQAHVRGRNRLRELEIIN